MPKGGLAIPARFREALAEGVILTRGIDRCLALYPLDGVAAAGGEGRRAAPHRCRRAQLPPPGLRRGCRLEPGSQGRILIPPDLRRYAGIEREALVVGVDTSIEIWSPQRWAAVESSLDTDGAEIAQRLATPDLILRDASGR